MKVICLAWWSKGFVMRRLYMRKKLKYKAQAQQAATTTATNQKLVTKSLRNGLKFWVSHMHRIYE